MIGLFCVPVVSYGNVVTKELSGFTQQVVPGYGTIIAAHFGLSGSWFYYVNPDDIVLVVYQDGSRQKFRVEEVKRYQMFDGYMKDLETEEFYTFNQVYDMDSKHLNLQTCIENEEMTNPSWGRLFVTGVPIYTPDVHK